MKKILIIMILAAAFTLVACGEIDLYKELSNIDWELEFVSNMDGEVATNEELKLLEGKDKLNTSLIFDNDKFKIEDEIGLKTYEGSYTWEEVGKSYKLLLNTNDGHSIDGVYGVREIKGEKDLKSITLLLENKIYSFIESDNSQY